MLLKNNAISKAALQGCPHRCRIGAAAPQPARPSHVEDSVDWEAYEATAEAAYAQVLAVMRPLAERTPGSRWKRCSWA